MTLKKIMCVCAAMAAALPMSAAAEEAYDFWADALNHVNVLDSAGRPVGSYRLDYADVAAGDFSLAFTAPNDDTYSLVITPGRYLEAWNLGPEWHLQIALKSSMPDQTFRLAAEITRGDRAQLTFTQHKQNDWIIIESKLDELPAEMRRLSKVLITLELKKSAMINLDGVHFYDPVKKQRCGVTEKTIGRRMSEAQVTRAQRVREAFARTKGGALRQELNPYFAQLYLNQDVEQVNAELIEILTTTDKATRIKYRLHDHWCLVDNQWLYHMYYAFGAKGRIAPGRITPQLERVILDVLWRHMLTKNDIHVARQSTWWMTGSENHDLVGKVSCLITSQIFMNEPEYADRVYPDLGKGGGSNYWFHQMYAGTDDFGPEGRGDFKDGREYRAKDHFEAWRTYFLEYFAERARKGFFLEVAAPGYMGTTVPTLTDIYDLCQDDALREQSRRFLDLVWAEWAQDQISGVRGGAKTRNPNSLRHVDSMHLLGRFLLGGAGETVSLHFTQLISDYRLPEVVWSMALDRRGMGAYAYVSRKPGEEENVWPRPLGNERTMLCDTESRLVRYSWVTPDYILGTQMDHPAAVHCHLSVVGRWLGVTFADSAGARIFPCEMTVDDSGKFKHGKGAYWRSVQHETVLITQQARRWTQVNPEWYPAPPMGNLPTGIYFGADLDELIERNGWIFARKNNAYVGVRIILGPFHNGYAILSDVSTNGLYEPLQDNAYRWNAGRTMIALTDKFSPIIFETGRRAEDGDFTTFQDRIIAHELLLHKTVVPGWYIVLYRGGRDNQQFYFNAANNEIPMIDGAYVDYRPPQVFDSPYLKSAYNSGVVQIKKPPYRLTLDFNELLPD